MRWCKIADFRETRTWDNPKARNLYLWLVVSAIYPEAKKIISLDKLGRQTGMSKDAARHCIKLLVADGLISYKPGTIIINDPSRPMESNQAANTDGQPITDPLPILRAQADEMEREMDVQHGSLHKYMEPFCKIQAAQGRSWPSLTELKRHFVNWVMKNNGRQIVENKIKMAAERQKAREEEEYKRAHGPAPQPTKQDIAKEWYKQITQLKQKAAEGNPQAKELLEKPFVKIWRQKLNI